MVDLVVVGAALALAVPGAWLALSGLFGLRAIRRARELTPVPPGDVESGPTTVRGPARPLFPDESLPAPDEAGLALAYTYRVLRLPDADAPLGDAETVTRGIAAVPFVVGEADGVLVHPEGAELHVDAETVERFEGDPPERIASFLAFQDVDLDPSGAAHAVVVSALAPGDEVYVTGLAERATEDAAEELPGEYVLRRGAGSVPFVVADSPDARGSGRHVQRGVVHLVVGLGLLASAALLVGL